MSNDMMVIVKLERALWDRLSKIGAQTRRDESEMAREAIASYVQDEEATLAAIENGLAELDAGKSVPHADVDRWLRSWGKPDELPPPKCK